MNKDKVIQETQNILDVASRFFERINGCSKYLSDIDRLRRKLWQPCVLAVGGKVKAGKSSFINALLGKQLAKVGELETTATINIFRHISYAGAGYTKEKPVKVVWDNGLESWVDATFMDSLQGNDNETLQKAEGISHLEYYIDDNDLLLDLTLVDTPGTDAVVNAHQEVADRFFLPLRQKHSEQTTEQMDKADAVIYLVGAVAGANAKRFLNDFQNNTPGASAINAIGVLAKVDIDEELLARRHEQAEYVADSLRDELYTVIPVSAGMHEAIINGSDRFPILQQWLKKMPRLAFDTFMAGIEYYKLNDDYNLRELYRDSDQTIPSLEERLAMKGDMQWSLFRTISNELYNSDNLQDALQHLNDIANIDTVRKVVEERFFNRSKEIRSGRVLKDLQIIVRRIKQSVFDELRSIRADREVWLSIISIGESWETKDAADALRRFISSQLPSIEVIDKLESDFYSKLILPIEDLLREIDSTDREYQHLSSLQTRRDKWPEEEYNELCMVFGMYGDFAFPDDFDIYERQAYWQNKSALLRDRRDQSLADYAVECYGKLINKKNAFI